MGVIKLIILAKDILETSYFDCKACAITKALQREGYEGWTDSGTAIMDENGKSVVDMENIEYDTLYRIVIAMYRTKHTDDNRYKKDDETLPIEDRYFEIHY